MKKLTFSIILLTVGVSFFNVYRTALALYDRISTPTKLIINTDFSSITADACSPAINVTTRDSSNNSVNTASNVIVSLNDNSTTGSFYSEPSCSNASEVTSTTIPAGQSYSQVYFKDTITGSIALSASGSGFTTGTAIFLVNQSPTTPWLSQWWETVTSFFTPAPELTIETPVRTLYRPDVVSPEENIIITEQNITIPTGAINTSNGSVTGGGNIMITSNGSMPVTGSSIVSPAVNLQSTSGNISVGGNISSSGGGGGGSVTITAGSSISPFNVGPGSESGITGSISANGGSPGGNGGNINVTNSGTGGIISVGNNIDARSSAQGNGGNITIPAYSGSSRTGGITLPPINTLITPISIRSNGQCANGSCAESTTRVPGTFDETPDFENNPRGVSGGFGTVSDPNKRELETNKTQSVDFQVGIDTEIKDRVNVDFGGISLTPPPEEMERIERERKSKTVAPEKTVTSGLTSIWGWVKNTVNAVTNFASNAANSVVKTVTNIGGTTDATPQVPATTPSTETAQRLVPNNAQQPSVTTPVNTRTVTPSARTTGAPVTTPVTRTQTVTPLTTPTAKQVPTGTVPVITVPKTTPIVTPTPITKPITAPTLTPTPTPTPVELNVDTKVLDAGVVEGDKIQLKATVKLSDGTNANVTGEATWQVVGPVGTVTPDGEFRPKLGDSVSEYGEAYGAILVTWKDKQTGKMLSYSTKPFKVQLKIDNDSEEIGG